MKRIDGRTADQLRPVSFQIDFTENPLASVLCEFGRTRVLCTACVEESVPRFLMGSGRGWLTAEYGLLPGSTDQRVDREAARGRVSGRTQEIQRLIGRSLRAITDLQALGERTLWLDCDVLQADGGTRTASVSGAFVALALAVGRMREGGFIDGTVLRGGLAAISVGIVGGEPLLDLCYAEDSRAEVDMNIIGTSDGRFAEVQGTGEEHTFSRTELARMLELAEAGIADIIAVQNEVLRAAGTPLS
ncbi:MAG: ribonuclease PH [Myxococcales bacterium]|nr:ribonuclease PH [Myxococcales bacterium]